MTLEEISKKYTNNNMIQAKVLIDMVLFECNEDKRSYFYCYFLHNLEILKFLRSLDLPFSEYILTDAILEKSVSFETIKWLHESGAHWDEETFEKALYCNRPNSLHIIKWMIKEGCPRNKGCLIGILHDWDESEREEFMLWVKDGCQ